MQPNWYAMTDVEKRAFLKHGQDWDSLTREERAELIAWLDVTFPGHGYTVDGK